MADLINVLLADKLGDKYTPNKRRYSLVSELKAKGRDKSWRNEGTLTNGDETFTIISKALSG